MIINGEVVYRTTEEQVDNMAICMERMAQSNENVDIKEPEDKPS